MKELKLEIEVFNSKDKLPELPEGNDTSIPVIFKLNSGYSTMGEFSNYYGIKRFGDSNLIYSVDSVEKWCYLPEEFQL